MGGSGEFVEVYEDFPFVKMDKDAYTLMLVALAQPIQTTFELLFEAESTPDFSEMLMHHIIHLILIFCCIVSNFTAVGCLTLLCHSISDIWMQGTKMLLLMNRTSEVTFYVVWLLNHLTWVWFRMVCLVTMAFTTSRYDFSFPEKFRVNFTLALPFSLIFIIALIILNFYWYFLLCLASYRGLTGQQIKDP